MNPGAEFSYRRVVVAVDASRYGQYALEAAAGLAKELRAELQGLFVEDINLLRLAGLPFAHEVTGTSASQRQLERSRMERSLRARAEQVRSDLASTAIRAKVEWSFGITRGHIAKTTLAASDQADLSIVGHESFSAPAPTARRGVVSTKRIAIVYDGKPTSHRTLDVARRIALATSADLLLLFAGSSVEQTLDFQAHCREVLPPVQHWTCVNLTASAGPQPLIEAVLSWHSNLLLINRDNSLLSANTLERLINELPCPTGLVR